jgi:hypothetical protein
MNIITELESLKKNYDTTIELVDGLTFSQKKLIRTIEFYSNSKYINGQKDERGRDKPYYQILNAVCDVENSAKDINTSDIQATSDDGNHYTESMFMTKDIYVYMKESNFGKTLNDMRDVHSRYGALLVKKCLRKDKNGKEMLYIELPAWKNLITDQVDILNNPIIEGHYMTAKELSDKLEVWEKEPLKKVIQSLRDQGSTKRVPVYEIRGMFPRSYIKELNGEEITDEDKVEYSYQLHYVAGTPTVTGRRKLSTDAHIPLYWEDDTEEVYKYLARKPRAGRAFGVGVFEEGEEAQVWTNDTVLKQFRAMEYTSKVIAQSASKKVKGRNLLAETDDGVVLEVEHNKPIVPVQLLPSGGLGQYQNLINQWNSQLEKTTSAYAAQRGDTPLSGTPFRLQATVLQQSSSVFRNLQQELGIFITEIFEDWIMPYLATKLNREHILAYDFTPEELKEIDRNFATRVANERAAELMFEGKIVSAEDYQAFLDNADEFIKQTKNKRFLNIPKDFYKNFSAKITVNVTGEQRNKAATLESLTNILMTVANNPALTQDPVLSQVLMKIIELSGAGISPVSISAAIAEKNKQQQLAAPEEEVTEPQPVELSLEANPTPVV